MSNNVILYNTEDGMTKLELHLTDGTVWLSQMEIAELFQTTRQNINKHINTIFSEGELDEKVVSNYQLHTTQHGARVSGPAHYTDLSRRQRACATRL